MDTHTGSGIDRRGFILGMAGTLAAAALPQAGRAVTAGFDLARPAEAMLAMLRMQARLDGRDAPWWYFGRIYGVVGEGAPRLLVRFEGLEIMRVSALPDDSYAATGVTTSFFQDPFSKAVLQEFANPYTGVTNTVTPNLIGGTGRPIAIYSDRGVRPARVKPEEWRHDGEHLTWDEHEGTLWLSHARQYPPGLPQPMGESSVVRARAADVHDRERVFVPAGFSSTYFAPWPAWMQMQGRAGHVIWHADGVKLESVEALPPAFLQRMREQHPARLAAVPGG
jgi:hypothetical protein